MSESALEKSDAPSLFSFPDAAKLFLKMVQILPRFRRCSAVMAQDYFKFCFMAGAWPRGDGGGHRGRKGVQGMCFGSDKMLGQMTKIKWRGTIKMMTSHSKQVIRPIKNDTGSLRIKP